MTGTCNRLDEDKAGPVWTNNCVSNLICLFTFCLPWNSQLVFWSIFASNSIIKYKFQVKSDWPFHLTRWIWNNRSVKPVKILKIVEPWNKSIKNQFKKVTDLYYWLPLVVYYVTDNGGSFNFVISNIHHNYWADHFKKTFYLYLTLSWQRSL